MARLASVVCMAAFFAGVAVAGLREPGGLERPLVLRGAASTSPLLGVDFRRNATWLVRLDPRTLAVRPRRRLAFGNFSPFGSSYSPDRRWLAFGGQSSTRLTYDKARLRLVDTRTLRTARTLSLGIVGDVVATQWATRDRLFAVVRSREDSGDESAPAIVVDRVVVADPTTGVVLARHEITGSTVAVASTDRALVLVLAPARYGPVRLVLARTDGTVAAVALERIWAGLDETTDGVPRLQAAGVAVEPRSGRAYVVAAGAPVAEVALDTLAVGYHTLAQPVSLLGRLHDWLEPRAQAKFLEGSRRLAYWLGDGRLAVFGYDTSTYRSGDRLAMRQRPSGLLVIDTRSWSSSVIDGRASELAVAKDALLSWGWGWDSGTQRELGTGVRIYDRTGAGRFHLFGARVILSVQVVGGRAFVRPSTGNGYSIIDTRTGRQIRTIRGRELPLVLGGQTLSTFG